MAVAAVSEATFAQEVLRAANPVLVVFAADRCRPYWDMAPALEKLALEQSAWLKIVKLDVDKLSGIRADYGVRGLPTLILFKGGQPAARRVGAFMRKESLEEWINFELIRSTVTTYSAELPRASGFRLANGMEVAVIPDHRVPVVTHSLWYRVGAADEPEGLSGLACLLAHLMFKSRDDVADGEFSKIVTDLGGLHNAAGFRDTTVYFERITCDQLKPVMELEAARMAGLRLAPGEVERERQTIIEQRRSTVAVNPVMRLREKMDAALYQDHPYAALTIGKVDDINRLSRKDALHFYKRHYAPNNAVLVVCGDVTEEEVRVIAESTYGKIPANPDVRSRQRAQGPEVLAPRRLTHKDPRLVRSMFQRRYVVPSYVTGRPGEPEALDLLLRILCIGPASRLRGRLVDTAGLATGVGGDYRSEVVDFGTLGIAVAARERKLGAIEAAVDEVIEDIRSKGPTEAELARAKKALLADYVYASGNHAKLVNRYGCALAAGRNIAQIEAWPENIARTTVDDIVKTAAQYLDISRSVTGWLLPG